MTEVEIDWFDDDRAELDTLFALADDLATQSPGIGTPDGYSLHESPARSSATRS